MCSPNALSIIVFPDTVFVLSFFTLTLPFPLFFLGLRFFNLLHLSFVPDHFGISVQVCVCGFHGLLEGGNLAAFFFRECFGVFPLFGDPFCPPGPHAPMVTGWEDEGGDLPYFPRYGKKDKDISRILCYPILSPS